MRTKAMTRTLCAIALTAFLHAFQQPACAQGKEEINKAAALLKGGSESEKAPAAQKLATIGSAEALEPLFEALTSEPDAEIAAQVGVALEKLTNDAGFKALAKQLSRWSDGRGIFAAWWALTGIARGKTAAGDELIKSMLLQAGKAVYLRAAAFEALGEAARVDCDSWLIEQLRGYKKDPAEREIIGILSALTVAPKLVNPASPDNASRNGIMDALVLVLSLTANDRVKYFASHALASITGAKPYLDVEFWRTWLKNNGGGNGPAPEDKRTGVRFFEAEAAGRKIAFCIDISGSMNFKLKLDAQNKGPVTREPGKQDGPDYAGVTTRLELAKTELIWTLAHLPDDYYFNIITYSKDHQLLDKTVSGFVKASKDNRTKFGNLVRALKAEGGTNIHGGLLDSFRLIEKGMAEENPAYDAKALINGADTIFFLTDGHPSWSDDTTETEVRRDGQTYGTGKMVDPKNILKWAALTNRFRKVVINTIGIGDHAKELLEELAKLTFGVYIDRTGLG